MEYRAAEWVEHPHSIPKSILQILNVYPDSAPLFSISWNGYTREGAVRAWPKVNNAFELALLLLRLNDWVSPVRRAAFKTLKALMSMPSEDSGLTAETVIGCMAIILDKSRFGRSRESELQLLNQLLNLEKVMDRLEEFVVSSAQDEAILFLRLALKKGMFERSLIQFATNAKHQRVRAIAVNTILTRRFVWKNDRRLQQRGYTFSDNEKIKTAKNALNDGSTMVQRAALDFVIQEQPSELHKEEVYNRFLNHKSISVAERAVFGLKSLGCDWMNEARSALSKGELERHHLFLFSRHGSADDAGKIFDLAKSLSGVDQIRYQGIAARLGHQGAMDALEHVSMADPDDNLASLASRQLYKSAYRPDYEGIVSSIRAKRDIVGRGYLPFIFKFPTMKFAMAIAAMDRAEIELNYGNLFRSLRKKRNIGAFLPTVSELESLKNSVKHCSALKSKMEHALGIDL